MTRIALLLSSLALAGAASAEVPSANLPIKPEMIRFNYASWDGGDQQSCAHEIENAEAQDWKVVCGGHRFTVHLWVSAYSHKEGPQLSYEILYWVTDTVHTVSVGSTTWIHLKDATALAGLSVRQSVDGDTAGLYLELKPQP